MPIFLIIIHKYECKVGLGGIRDARGVMDPVNNYTSRSQATCPRLWLVDSNTSIVGCVMAVDTENWAKISLFGARALVALMEACHSATEPQSA